MKLLAALGLWVAALTARVTVFAGGGVGSWLSVGAFGVASVLLLVLAVHGIRQSRGSGKAPYILVIVGLVAFGYRILIPSGLSAEISTAIWLVCAICLVITGVRTAVHGWRTAT